jgi:hypothetical protein
MPSYPKDIYEAHLTAVANLQLPRFRLGLERVITSFNVEDHMIIRYDLLRDIGYVDWMIAECHFQISKAREYPKPLCGLLDPESPFMS